MALTLSRRVGESIVIGDIVVTVSEIRGSSVRLSVQAPRSIPIHRAEIHEVIHPEQRVTPTGIVPSQQNLTQPEQD